MLQSQGVNTQGIDPFQQQQQQLAQFQALQQQAALHQSRSMQASGNLSPSRGGQCPVPIAPPNQQLGMRAKRPNQQEVFQPNVC